MCLGCKEQKQIQEKGAVSWTIGVHWTFAFVSQLAVVDFCTSIVSCRVSECKAHGVIVFFFSYNLQHTPGSWLGSWLDEVHTKNQPLWSSFRNATRPTPPKVLRSLRRHTCTSQKTKHHTCALCGYILKALISVWFSRSHSLSPYECAVVYSSLVLLFCASLVVSRSTLQTCRMRSSQTHTKNTRWCLAAHVLCYVHSLSGFHYLADNSRLTSALCSSSGPAYYMWSRILCLCWLKGKLMWEFKATFSAHPKTRSKVKNYRRSSSCTDIMDEK